MHQLEVKNIKKAYGKKSVLEDVSFEADEGEWIILVGDNGCGKSTLLQIIAASLKADAGNIIPDDKIRRRFGYVPQDNPLFGELTVKENIKFFAGKNEKSQKEIIEKFGLEDIIRQRVDTLSGGQRRRLAIACGMIGNPAVLILDEPTTALDFHYQKLIDEMLYEYVGKGGCIIMTSHNSDELKMASRILRMHDGILCQED